MPRGSSRRRRMIDDEASDDDFNNNDIEEDADEIEFEAEAPESAPSSSPAKRGRRASSGKRQRRSQSQSQDMEGEDYNGSDNDIVEEPQGDYKNDNSDMDDDNDDHMMFSSQRPDLTQEILPVRPIDHNNLMKLGSEAREKAIQDLLRLILFKGLAGEPIDRTKIIKEAGISDAGKISRAAFEKANERLEDIFDFKLARLPKWMESMKDVPSKYKDRYFLINQLSDDGEGEHCRALHEIYEEGSIEKGLLMVVLGFVFCKGEPRSDGSRWLLDKDLYELLHKVDDNIHSEPPIVGVRRRGRAVEGTPDVDHLLQKFVHMDYLLAFKAGNNEQFLTLHANAESESIFYALGPRAAVEIGRAQIIYFCAQVMDTTPDPTMLQEIEGDDEDE